MHSSRTCTAHSLTISHRILCTSPGNHTCPLGNHACPPATTHAPSGNHAHPPATTHAPNHACPLATMHTPQQPHMPPSNHACPPTMHAPSNHTCPPTTHAPGNHTHPWQPHTPPGNHTHPPATTHTPWQPHTPSNHTPLETTHAPLWTWWQTGVKILPCLKLHLRAVKMCKFLSRAPLDPPIALFSIFLVCEFHALNRLRMDVYWSNLEAICKLILTLWWGVHFKWFWFWVSGACFRFRWPG